MSKERGKPVLLPSWAGDPQGDLLAVRVEDRRESECRAVMVRIGVATSLHGKPGRLLRGR